MSLLNGKSDYAFNSETPLDCISYVVFPGKIFWVVKGSRQHGK